MRLVLFVGAVFGGVAFAQATNKSETYFEELERFRSYGRSPSFYPTPVGTGLGDWASVYQQAQSLVSNMTFEEKANITSGYEGVNGCGGNGGSVPRLDIPGLCYADASAGVRAFEGVNSYPAGIHLGATWNRDLAYMRALHLGAEFKRKGANVALAPSVGGLGRVVKGGRNWESPSNDPYLTGALTAPTIRGLQQSVIACVKHLIANEQETNRKAAEHLPTKVNASVSSNLDDQTMHELYLWPFYDAIHAGAGSVMCAYNRVNNSYSCQNSKLMNDLLKTQLGFQGFVVSDWYEHKSGVGSANAGLDVVMPVAPLWNGKEGSLVDMVNNGSVNASRLDDMATRIVATWLKYGTLEKGAEGKGFPLNPTLPHEYVEARDPASKTIIRQSAIEGHVLVKNVRNALPFKKPKFLSVFGYDAVAQGVNTPDPTGFTSWAMGHGGAQRHLNGSAFSNDTLFRLFGASEIDSVTGPSVYLNGTLISGGGSGASTGVIHAPLDALKRRAYDDDTFLFWDTSSYSPFVNPASQACLVFINAMASEGYDRKNLTDAYSDHLVTTVASQCSNTIVVVHAAGIRLVDPWIEHDNVTAVIMAHLPGQDSGPALVEILYGEQSPSGRLPYTIAKRESDYGHLLEPDIPRDDHPFYPQSNFTEGVFIDYKHFDQSHIEPRFEFGFGLSYTTFAFSNLTIDVDQTATVLPPNPDVVLPGGISSLWDEVGTITCVVSNTGNVSSAEVAQLYLNLPGEGPSKILRGFEKKVLAPGTREIFKFPLVRRDLSSWDTEKQQWVLNRGSYGVMIRFPG
ncbi:glycosyl hydrolase family 3 N terminal domain-containing protein [Fusarium redolens]|uniref:Beta-glucosidase cel3A n=1 Tax=Fusarium redolens TaxID=48865 RepID=A0A9P9KBX5_FUSRE|nr:glycosyl hydrolase family 3 N terminal domain-containing protein [Fusarium redolens]KAH7247394.1 glycosyl hydrolase family 3 N terminal domain-containing protein [Fusarium redolens]